MLFLSKPHTGTAGLETGRMHDWSPLLLAYSPSGNAAIVSSRASADIALRQNLSHDIY